MVTPVFFAVVLGTIIRTTAVLLFALGTIQLIGATITVFGLRGTTDPLRFYIRPNGRFNNNVVNSRSGLKFKNLLGGGQLLIGF